MTENNKTLRFGATFITQNPAYAVKTVERATAARAEALTVIRNTLSFISSNKDIAKEVESSSNTKELLDVCERFARVYDVTVKLDSSNTGALDSLHNDVLQAQKKHARLYEEAPSNTDASFFCQVLKVRLLAVANKFGEWKTAQRRVVTPANDDSTRLPSTQACAIPQPSRDSQTDATVSAASAPSPQAARL